MIKPINKEKLFHVLDRLEKKEKSQSECKVLMVTGSDLRNIQINQLMYIEAYSHESILHLVNENLNVREGIGEIAKN